MTSNELIAGIIRIGTALAIPLVVWRVVRRVSWPRPFRLRFALMHVVLALSLAMVWAVVSGTLEGLVPHVGADEVTDRWSEFLTLGSVLYLLSAGAAYAVESSARAARAEAMTAQAQLAALRAQLHPHFLFNVLHTVIQLIPLDPVRAAEAAELVAQLLRTTLEEERNEVTLEDEWRFVSQYLAIERLRFGERLNVRVEIPAALLQRRVPAFALQTLVENAVRHGAAPRIEPTEIFVGVVARPRDLTISVRNTGQLPGVGASSNSGTGLARLRDRLAVLHGASATLAVGPLAGGGFEAILVLPQTSRNSG